MHKGASITGKQSMGCFNFAAGVMFVFRTFWQEAILTGNHKNGIARYSTPLWTASRLFCRWI